MRNQTFTALLRPAAFLTLAAACFAAPPRSPAVPAARPPAASAAKPAEATSAVPLDTARVHKLYMESEFDEAIPLLERDLKGNRPLGHADSVFIYKYLGVMYTSKYETRELGKRYLYQLLTVEPAARISDMFASDMIYMIFKNVQDEYFATHPHAAPPPPPPHHSEDPKGSSGHAAWYWAGGAGLAVAVGVVAYVFILNQSKEKVGHPVSP